MKLSAWCAFIDPIEDRDDYLIYTLRLDGPESDKIKKALFVPSWIPVAGGA